ncbi:hypothetical protein EDB19DRAFT_1922132 [Suillus lakei]|nr:hypothetical protein EDB19DRAFT_1922905 [Suillus lakei]KAG1717750.1 hypothetical protein EDB19DRAFT_1922132 [Suillus lakei]
MTESPTLGWRSSDPVPTLDVFFKLDKGEYTAGPITMQVALVRGADKGPDDRIQTVTTLFYPTKKGGS